MFNPAPLNLPGMLPEALPQAEPLAPVAPIAPEALAPPVLTMPAPTPIQIVAPKPKKGAWDAAIIRRAQGIYPAEAQAKAAQMESAKMPTPTGAWGAPK